MQVLGGTNITFRNFQIGNYDAGLSTCQGAGGAFFYSMASTNIRVEGGKFIACNHSLFAGNPAPVTSPGAMFRSGRNDGTDPVCVGYAGSPACTGPVLGSGVTTSGITCQRWNSEPRPLGLTAKLETPADRKGRLGRPFRRHK